MGLMVLIFTNSDYLQDVSVFLLCPFLVYSCQSFILVQVPECVAFKEQVRFKRNQTNKQNTLHYCVSTELRAANLLNKGFLFMYAMCIRV